MKPFLIAIGAIGLISAPAQEVDAPLKVGEIEEQLFQLEGGKEEFLNSLAKARQAGVSEQSLLEARFLFFAEHQDEQAIAGMAADLRAAVSGFDPEKSRIFATTEAFLSVVFYAEALKALGAGDLKGFEVAIKEAFWNGPGQAGVFAEPIERLRTREAMKLVQVDLGLSFKKQEGEGAATLKEILGDGKAIALHFWSPWHRECLVSVPELAKFSPKFQAAGIASVMVLPQQGEDQLVEAKELLQAHSKSALNWLIDRDQKSLGSLLRVDSLPLTVIVDRGGKVVFHGETGGEEMWQAMIELDPSLEIPENQAVEGSP